MKGIPYYIQTHEDLQNLMVLAIQRKADREALSEKIRGLLALQWQSVPIISHDGNSVTAFYSGEIQMGDVTDEGLMVTGIEHVDMPSESIITLSAAPKDKKVMRIYRCDNYLRKNGFDVDEMKRFLEVLAQ